MLGTVSMDTRYSDLVEKLVEVERQPLLKLQKNESNLVHLRDDYATIKNQVSNLKDLTEKLSNPEDFRIYKVESDTDNELSITTDSKVSPGYYSINVTQVAREGKKSSAGFADKNLSLGQTGTLTVTVNGSSFNTDITTLNNSLEGIKDTINNDSENNLVRAGIVNVDDGLGGTESRLVLTTVDTGSSQDIQMTDASGTLSTILDLTTITQAPQDATVVLDGFNVTSESNVLKDVVDGLTIDIHDVTSGTVNFKIMEDKAEITGRVESFVKDINALFGMFDAMDDSDSSMMKRSISDILHDVTGKTGAFKLLTEIGISLNTKTGKYEINSDKLSDSVIKSYDDVKLLFSEPTVGIAAMLEQHLDSLLDIDGTFSLSEKSISSRIDKIQDKILREDDKLDALRESLTRRFATLESMVTKMENTQDYLKTQLDNVLTMGAKKK